MISIQTVGEAFIKFLEDRNVGVYGQNLFMGEIPQDAPDECWLVTVSGGGPETITVDGGMLKVYTFNVFRRSLSGKEIERKLFSLEEVLNNAACVTLEGFQTIHSRATQFAQDNDLENERRRIGLLQAQVRLYKENTQIS